MKIAIIGIGLIGGSMAIDLRKRSFTGEIIGVDSNQIHAQAALRLGLIDRVSDLKTAVNESELIILATPADVTCKLLPAILDLVTEQAVMDVSSIKEKIEESIAGHKNRTNFVSTHPMAGTENSGPWAAHASLFEAKAVIFVNTDKNEKRFLEPVYKLYDALGMRPLEMSAKEHDIHVAYVSHISHISSFALSLTVLAKEKNTRSIFDLASGGFDSTVRLAKSSPEMWTPVFMHNKENVLEVLETYVSKLLEFKNAIKEEDHDAIMNLVTEANKIRKVLQK
jgi:prephenate dehydrogenase